MVEIFKTNVDSRKTADMLIAAIHESFAWHSANFDLEDRDLILRIQNINGPIEASSLIHLLKSFGYTAELLPDEIPDLAGI